MDSAELPEGQSATDAEDVDGRSTNRESLFLGVEIRRAGSSPSGRIRNISATGALVEADTQFVVGEHIVLTFRSVTNMGATVVRKTARGVGVRFDSAIDPTLCKQSVLKPESKTGWTPPPQPMRYRHPGLQGKPRR